MSDSASAASTTSIPVVTNDRGELHRRARSTHRRGVPGLALERGVLAETAILAANARTDAYRTELDAVRVKLALSEDAIRDYNARSGITGLRVAPIAAPPDPLTAEILKRDAHLTKWSDSYQRLADAAARERSEHRREMADAQRQLAIAKDDILCLEASCDRMRARESAPGRASDQQRRRSPDPALAEAARERDDLRERIRKLNHTLQNDAHWYNKRENASRTKELDALQQNLGLHRHILDLQAQLQRCGLSSEAGPVPAPDIGGPPADDQAPMARGDPPGGLFDGIDFGGLDSPLDQGPFGAIDGRGQSPSSDFRTSSRDRSPSTSAATGSSSGSKRRARVV